MQTFSSLPFDALTCMDAFEAGAPPEPEPAVLGAPAGATALLPIVGGAPAPVADE